MMRKFIEYMVKGILIVLVLLAYQSFKRYTDAQFVSSYKTLWSYFGYASMILSYIVCGMIIAYNERKSGKASVTKFVLVLIAILLIGFPFSSVLGNTVLRNYVMLTELVKVFALTFGILLTGIKF
jgi:hypothetical protein